MRRTLAALMLAALAITFSLVLAPSATAKKPGGGNGGTSPKYSIVRLDDDDGVFAGGPAAGAFAVNEQRNVAGTVYHAASGNLLAAFWYVSGTTSTIVPLGSGHFANGLNNFNEIVGHRGGTALYWPSPTAAPAELPSLGLAAVAYDINDGGVICGYARDPIFDEMGAMVGWDHIGVVWRITYPNGELRITGPVRLPTLDDRSQAYAINENQSGAANVVGVYTTAVFNDQGELDGFVRSAAVQWTVHSGADGTLSVEPAPIPLELGEAAAFGVNNLGVSCGQALRAWTEPKGRVWLGEIGSTLSDPAGRSASPLHNALDVNDDGVIVGAAGAHTVYRDAVVWPSAAEEPVVLDKFLPRRDRPFELLTEATAINEDGVIVGIGTNGSDDYGFLAVPK